MATLTPEAKQLLSRTVRELRELMLQRLRDSAEQRYRLSLPLARAKLPEELRKKRERLEAWLDERGRTASAKERKAAEAARSRFLDEALKEAAATLLNRLILLRHLEALGLSRPAIVTGGWTSKGYQELREFAPGLCGDETEGYAALLGLVFDELAVDLPGLFGDVGLTRLFPMPPELLREVVQRLDDPGLAPAWTDDTTLGWVYQYWNDPEREDLDKKLNDGGKIEPHEIASKTQMFTERYMVEWLLQNSLGLTWLCICKKRGWTPDAERVLPILDARRADWRKKREVGEVPLDALMPIEGELEERWKYFVPQRIPDDAVASAPESVHTLKLLDPACGSGHFLIIAFDLLVAMYREEARHRGEDISDREIAESILQNNLHGIDIDPRAVQIAAAAVVLKAKRLARDARPSRVNLVAPVLRLGNLSEDDPALVRLRRELKAEAGIPEELTGKLVKSLAGLDHLGSLLKVDAAIDDAIREQERAAGKGEAGQGDLLSGRFPAQQAKIDWAVARATVLDRLESFLAHHAGEEDLGLRLDGEQVAAGVRFVRIAKERSFDLVVANPPYQSVSKLTDRRYLEAHYPSAKADLYAAFIDRGLALARTNGLVATVTMRGWLFLGQFLALRERILADHALVSMADLDTGAFESLGGAVVNAAMTVLRRESTSDTASVAIMANALAESNTDGPRRKQAMLLAQSRRQEFSTSDFGVIKGSPLVYWWPKQYLWEYGSTPKLGEEARVIEGLGTRNDARFVRFWFEVSENRRARPAFEEYRPSESEPWVPFIKGAQDRVWFEPLIHVVNWSRLGLELGTNAASKFGRGASHYFKHGVAYSTIGSRFTARIHRHASIFSDAGSSVFPSDCAEAVCTLNTSRARAVLQSLNPTVNFTNEDVERVPLFSVNGAREIVGVLVEAFARHEAGREASAEFVRPGRSTWKAASAWAESAVDRPPELRSPPMGFECVEPSAAEMVSFAVGVALGRFRPEGGVSAGVPDGALPGGVLFVSGNTVTDSLDHPAAAPIHRAWGEAGGLGAGRDLRQWLRREFFAHHRMVYQGRPIYFPLSSDRRSFVAWVSIHSWTSATLTALLADHLLPERRRLEGELEDLRRSRAKSERAAKGASEKRFAEVQKLLAELAGFADQITQIAERGPPPTSPAETKREVDARFEMDLDDGVMVNSAALWPLLEPQWKEPKKWWKELAEAEGRKDYDWAHLTKRYFPSRVEGKCKEEPSLAVAHGCFWRLHPAKAYAWELRLQCEIRPDFTIDEAGSDAGRKAFLEQHPDEANAIRLKEQGRRERKARKAGEDGNLSLALDESETEAETEEVE